LMMDAGAVAAGQLRVHRPDLWHGCGAAVVATGIILVAACVPSLGHCGPGVVSVCVLVRRQRPRVPQVCLAPSRAPLVDRATGTSRRRSEHSSSASARARQSVCRPASRPSCSGRRTRRAWPWCRRTVWSHIVCALPCLTPAVDPMRDAEPLPVWYVLFLRKPFVAIVVAHFCHNWSVGVLCAGYAWLSTTRGWFVILSWLPRFFEHLGVPTRMRLILCTSVLRPRRAGWVLRCHSVRADDGCGQRVELVSGLAGAGPPHVHRHRAQGVPGVSCTTSTRPCSPQPQSLATLMPAIFLTPFMIHGDFSLWHARAQCAT
jgi:hypothetical protein